MLIPIDRPLIDARNIREAATQTVAADDVADPALIHNNRATLRVTLTGPGLVHEQGTGVQAIQSGSRVGQRLRIIVVDDGGGNYLLIYDNAATAKTDLRGYWQSGGGESAITYNSYIDVEWDGTLWKEVERYDGIGWLATGIASHGEGKDNTAAGRASHVEGESNSADAWTAHAEGRYCGAASPRSHAEGYVTQANGTNSHAEGAYTQANGESSHAEGFLSKADLYAEHAYACGQFAAAGDAQFSQVVMRKATTDATLTGIFIDGVDDRLTILDEFTYACKVMVVGRQDTGADHFMGTYHVLIERTGGAVALVGAVDVIYENNAGGLGAGGGLPVEITAANNALTIKVEGLAGHNIRWVAVVEMVRVNYAN